MAKNSRTILFITYAFAGLLTERLITYLFPYTGLGGLVCYPTSIILSLLFGWALYKITTRSIKPFLIGVTFFVFISLQSIVELYVHPQDLGGSPYEQIADCKRASKNYAKISFDSFPELSRAERVAYLYKFKGRLPTSISTLSIKSSGDESVSQSSRKYMILNYNHDTTYDGMLLKIIHTDTSLVIIENPQDSSKINVHITDKYLLNNEAGGVIDRENSVMYNVLLDNLELSSGIEKLFYRYLTMTKKASR